MNLQQTAFAIYELMKSFSILKITNCMTRLRNYFFILFNDLEIKPSLLFKLESASS